MVRSTVHITGSNLVQLARCLPTGELFFFGSRTYPASVEMGQCTLSFFACVVKNVGRYISRENASDGWR